MSNVVKIADKKKKPGIDEWQAEVEEHAEKLMDRLYDQVRLADNDAECAEIPEEYVDCMIVGVLVSMLVKIASARCVLAPDALRKLVDHEIEAREE